MYKMFTTTLCFSLISSCYVYAQDHDESSFSTNEHVVMESKTNCSIPKNVEFIKEFNSSMYMIVDGVYRYPRDSLGFLIKDAGQFYLQNCTTNSDPGKTQWITFTLEAPSYFNALDYNNQRVADHIVIAMRSRFCGNMNWCDSPLNYQGVFLPNEFRGIIFHTGIAGVRGEYSNTFNGKFIKNCENTNKDIPGNTFDCGDRPQYIQNYSTNRRPLYFKDKVRYDVGMHIASTGVSYSVTPSNGDPAVSAYYSEQPNNLLNATGLGFFITCFNSRFSCDDIPTAKIHVKLSNIQSGWF